MTDDHPPHPPTLPLNRRDGQSIPEASNLSDSRAQLIGDVLTFQLKLAMDGLRDLVLMPISLAAGLLGLIRGGPNAGQPFRDVLAFGRRTEIWINLFGRHRGQTSDAILHPLREQVLNSLHVSRSSSPDPAKPQPVEPARETDSQP